MIKTSPDTRRIIGLDLMRSVAILLVVIHHGFNVFTFPFVPLPDGVDIFFVLSGFLIGRILVRTVEQRGRFDWADLKLFWCRRWLRTLPAYWITLLLNLTITFFLTLQHEPIRQTLKQIIIRDRLWQYIIFVQNLFWNQQTGFFNESWSLSVEEWFYLIVPICLFILLRVRFLPDQAMLIVIFFIIIGPTTVRYLFSNVQEPGTWMRSRMLVVMRLDSIAFGVLLAYINQYRPALWNRLATSGMLLIFGMLLFYLSFFIVHEKQLYFHSVTLTNMLFYPFTSFFTMISLPFLSRLTMRESLVKKAVTFISKISYSLYLVNFSIVVQLIHIFTPTTVTETGKFISYLLYWFCTIGLATLMYTCVEQPFMQFRDRYFADRQLLPALTRSPNTPPAGSPA